MARQTKLLLDVPAAHPALGFPRIAKGLSEVVLTSDPRFAIGILGGWGSGKTTLMQAMRDELEAKVVCVWFNAWRYEKEQDLIVPLLDSIRESLVKWSDEHGDRQARATAGALGRVMRALVAGLTVKVGVPGAVDLSFDANRSLAEHGRLNQAEQDAGVARSFYHASFRALERAFQDFVRNAGTNRIAIFVDDLDRCLPENALQVLESMKLFFDFDGFVFIAGLDEHAVEHAIDAKYRLVPEAGQAVAPPAPAVTGAEYIKKFFQLPYRLPAVTFNDISVFINSACAEGGLPDSQRTDLQGRVRPHLNYLVGDSNVNPREIKRYINLYLLHMAIDSELDPDVVLAMETVSFRRDWETAADALVEFREEFLDYLRQRAMDDLDDTHYLEEELGPLPQDLLEYVQDNSPGHSLVLTGDLSPYLAASRSPAALEALTLAGQVRKSLAKARRRTLDAQSLQSDLVRSLTGLAGLLAAMPETSATARVALTTVDNFRTQVIGTLGSGSILDDPAAAEGTVDVIVGPLEASARELSKRLRRLYRTHDSRGATSQRESGSEDESDVRERVLREATARGDAEAAFRLGALLQQQGDLDGAIVALRDADARDHPQASFNLGVLLAQTGDLQGAEAAFRHADEGGHAAGANNLGIVLKDRGDLEGAEAALRRADERGDAAAANNLARVLNDRANSEGAEKAVQGPDERGDPEAAMNLAGLRARHGELLTVGAELLLFVEDVLPGLVEYLKEMAASDSARRQELRVRVQEHVLGRASSAGRRVTLSYATTQGAPGQRSGLVLRPEPRCPGWGSTSPPSVDESTARGRAVLKLVKSETPIRICHSRDELERAQEYKLTARDAQRFPAYALIPMFGPDQAETIGLLEIEAEDELHDADTAELIAMASVLGCARVMDTPNGSGRAIPHA